MKIALGLLCMGGVAFLLRVAGSLRYEAETKPSSTVIQLAKFKPARQRGELVEMKVEDRTQQISPRRDERIAL